MTTPRSIRLLAALAAAGLVAGCATPGARSTFACPYEGGVRCMSVTEVYAATEHSARIGSDAQGNGARAQRGQPAPAPARESASSFALVVDDGSLGLMPTLDPVAAPASPREALRTPARVMRVWIAPWEDTHGDLHLGGHVLTEIEPRRWQVGESIPADRPALRLFQIPDPS